MFCELMSWSEQAFDMLLRQVNMMSRYFNDKGIMLLRRERLSNVRSAQRAQRFARHHSFFIGGYNQHCDLRIIGGNAAHLLESARLPIQAGVHRNIHALQTLYGQRSNLGASLTNSAGED